MPIQNNNSIIYNNWLLIKVDVRKGILMKKFFCLLSLLAVVLLTSCDEKGNNSNAGMKVYFLNVGKADCIVAMLDDMVIMNDTGDSDCYAMIKSFLEEHEISKIDYLILSHYDADHIANADNLLKDFEIGQIYGPDYVRDSNHYRKLVEKAEEKGVEFTKLSCDDDDYTFENGNAMIWINVPNEETYKSDDDYSLITSLYYDKTKVLLMGDCNKSRTIEFNNIINDTYNLIKLPHHGEYNKGEIDLVDKADNDSYYVVSTGSSDLVETKLMTLIENNDMDVYYTYDGTICFESDGVECSISQ